MDDKQAVAPPMSNELLDLCRERDINVEQKLDTIIFLVKVCATFFSLYVLALALLLKWILDELKKKRI